MIEKVDWELLFPFSCNARTRRYANKTKSWQNETNKILSQQQIIGLWSKRIDRCAIEVKDYARLNEI